MNFIRFLITITFSFFFFNSSIQAQIAPTFLGSQSFSASGSGLSGIPTVSYNIPAGTNRVMIVSIGMERNHSIAANTNWPASPDGTASGADSRPTVLIGGLPTTNLGNGYSSVFETTGQPTYLSTQYALYYLSDINGLPTGLTNITFPNLNTPENAGDEMVVSLSVFGNANPVPLQVNASATTSSGTTTAFSATGTAPAVPVGTTTSNIMYMSNGFMGQQGANLAVTPAAWTSMTNLSVNNTSGTAIPGSLYPNENDGIRFASVYQTGLSTNPTVTYTRTGSTSNFLGIARGIYAILPLARPSFSGTVYRDNNGLTPNVDAGGTGGGVWTTASTLWVNAVKDGVVIATDEVSNTGIFTFASGGALVEGDVVIFQLSNTAGVVGQAPPAKNLPSTYGTVGESTTSGPSDGTPDGEFTLTIGNANSPNNTTNRFGITILAACTTAPPVTSSLSNSCTTTTADLSTAHTGTIPAGATLEWYTNNTHTGTALTGTQITQAGAGTYYAFYYTASGNCYSPASAAVTITISPDSDGDGINDNCDLDDDNDGILDENERACTGAASIGLTVTSDNALATDVLNGTNPQGAIGINNLTLTHYLNSDNILEQVINDGHVTEASLPGYCINIDNSGLNFSQRIGSRIAFEYPIKNLKFRILDLDDNDVLIVNAYDLNGNIIPITTSIYTLNSPTNVITPITNNTFSAVGAATNTGNPGMIFFDYNGYTISKIEFEYYDDDEGGSYSIYDLNGSFCADLDTDGDGIVNSLDLDSDNDGCPDAIEGGGNFTTANLQNSTMSGGNTTATSGTYGQPITQNLGNNVSTAPATYGVPTIAGTGQSVGQSQDANKNDCLDTDSDLIPNYADLDDDNDGILDAVESPTCFYTNVEANTISSITSQFTSPDAFTLLHDGAATLTFNFNAFAAASNLPGSNLFTITYPTALPLTSVSVSDNISLTTGATGNLYGSNDNATWTLLSTAPVSITTTPITFSNNTPTVPYRYYQIRTAAPAGGAVLATANTIGEITSIINAAYIQSANQKPGICAADADADGIPNHLDLDTDGDGCPDAIEGGATLTSADLVNSSMPGGNSGTGYIGSSPNPVVQNLGNTVGLTATTLGVPSVAGTGQTLGTSQNGALSDCRTISGAVFNDNNGTTGNADGNPVNGTSTGTDPLNLVVNLYDAAGNFITSAPVLANGSYTLTGVPAGTGYQIQLNTAANKGSSGENISANPNTVLTDNFGHVSSSDNVTPTNGINVVDVAAANITGSNFGINKPPVAVSSTMPNQVNNQGPYSIPVPPNQFSGNDFNGGLVEFISITTFPSNVASITIDGTKYGTGFTPWPVDGVTVQANTSGQPSVPILIDPVDGINNVVISYVTIDNSGMASSLASVTVPFTIILPVTFGNISAIVKDCAVTVLFETLSEHNNKQFDIEHSTDGRSWKWVTTIQSKGSSNSKQLYTYTDTKAVKGWNYYRVKQTDLDRNAVYSQTIAINAGCNANGIYSVYPNPVSDMLQILIPGTTASKVQIRLSDAQGRILSTKVSIDNTTATLSVGHLPVGVYTLQVLEEKAVSFVAKIIKQ